MATTEDTTKKADSPAKRATARRGSHDKWGAKVMELGFCILPSLLFRAQRRLGLNPTQLAVLVQLADFWWDAGRKPFPKKADLAFRLGLSDRQVQRYIAELETAGFVRRIERTAAHRGKIVLINQQVARRDGDAAVLYGQAVVETVKVGLKRFRTVLDRETIGNVELILDVNHQNDRVAFDETLIQAKAQDGRFRGVTRFSRIDSSASRLLQLADLVAYSRKWIVSAEMNAKGLKERFGIQMP